MRWTADLKLLKMKQRDFVEKFLWFITKETARYFIRELVGKDMVPAWTGQARGSLTKAAQLVDVNIDYSDIVDKNRKNKNPSTGAAQGSAKFEKVNFTYGFEFRSWVADLNRDSSFNYWQENEYNPTRHNRVRQTPWRAIEEAGTETEKYIKNTIFPLLRDFLDSDIWIVTGVRVA